MKADQALRQAQETFGSQGAVAETIGEHGRTWFHVGAHHPVIPDLFVAKGVGLTWEQAFADATIADIRRVVVKQELADKRQSKRRTKARRRDGAA